MSDTFNNKFVIVKNYLPSPSKRRGGGLISKVRFLVAHDTGNPGSSASANVRYYINSANDMSASAHIFVDDKEIIECIPALTGTPEKAWHVLYNVPKDNELFGMNANDAAIGVEYCYGENIDADKAYQKYIWILAKLCFQFKLDPAKDITGHFFLDPRRKTDPVTGLAYSRRTYEQLLRDIVAEYNSCIGDFLPPTPGPETLTNGTVTVTVRLNIREAPNTLSEKIQVVSPGTQLNYVAIINDGQRINNNPIWYKDINGNYFWSGGTIQ